MSDRIPPRAPSDDWEAVARYLAGEATPAEAEAVRNWLAADPARQQFVAALREAGEEQRGAAAEPPPDVEAALRRVHERMRRPALHLLTGATTGSSALGARVGWSAALRAAAIVVLLLGGALVARRLLPHGGGEPATLASAHLYRAATGQLDSVRLADGTRVLLAPGSTLRVPADYAGRRQVALEGEALFEVQHDATHPFMVRVGAVTVQDIGTIFDVRGDAGAQVRVVVTHGSVEVRSGGAGPGLILHQSQAAVVDPGGAAELVRDSATADDLAWTQGRLVFRHAPMSEIAGALRRWYGVDLQVADPALADQHLTTSFGARDGRSHVLDVIALALGAHLDVRGDTAILTSTADGRR
jgi:transmembrane sensor